MGLCEDRGFVLCGWRMEVLLVSLEEVVILVKLEELSSSEVIGASATGRKRDSGLRR
jgi:hypothetical protein